MIRGTTDTFKFKLPCSCEEIKTVKIVFWQDGNDGPSEERPLPIVKVIDNCLMDPSAKEIAVVLSQEETLRFSDKRKGKVQFRAYSNSGSCFASKQELFTVYPLRDDDVLGDVVLPTPDNGDIVILDGEHI